MEIKDKEGKTRIKFYNYKKVYNDIPVFIEVSVETLIGNATAKESTAIELSDINELALNARKLYNTLKYTFYFQPIETQVQLKFEPLLTGNILVTGFLKDKFYTYTLNFSFEMSPSELLNMIEQSENIYEVLNT